MLGQKAYEAPSLLVFFWVGGVVTNKQTKAPTRNISFWGWFVCFVYSFVLFFVGTIIKKPSQHLFFFNKLLLLS